LSNEQDRRLQLRNNGKGQPHLHTGGIVPERRVEKVLDLGEFDDLVILLIDQLLGHPVQARSEVDVLPARQVRCKAPGDLNQGSYRSIDPDLALIRDQNTRYDL